MKYINQPRSIKVNPINILLSSLMPFQKQTNKQADNWTPKAPILLHKESRCKALV